MSRGKTTRAVRSSESISDEPVDAAVSFSV
jgi:hypothetical protein